jgi:hypothetical protein
VGTDSTVMIAERRAGLVSSDRSVNDSGPPVTFTHVPSLARPSGRPRLRGALGLAVGGLLSAADAVITKAYAPILVPGAVGGAAIGWVIGRFGR